MAGIFTMGPITAFEPQSTCLAPSNLWLTTMPCGTEWSGDDDAFRADTTHALTSPTCTMTLLGPPDREDIACYEPREQGFDYPVFNDCPVGMTSAWETTSDLDDGIKSMATICCPSAYEFSKFDGVPPTSEEDFYSTFFCRADAVTPLSDQTVTLTVSTAPLITTEVAWNDDTDFVYAYPAGFSRYVYEGSGTTSECFGHYDCLRDSNPLAAPTPTPTPTPTSSYIPPPSHPTTQFAPAPSCLGDSNMWLVSTSCQILARNGQILTPDWLECAITEFGEWNTDNEACYTNPFRSTTVGEDGTASFYAGCPAGYTTASETTYRPFDKGQYKHPTDLAAESYDVVVSSVNCCPGGDYSFKFSDVYTTSTSRPGGYQDVDMYPMPRCVIEHVTALSGKDVELTLAANNQVMDKKKRQEETRGPEVTTRPWNYADGLLFAEAAQASVTVFHGTYSCFENCDNYFTSSYNNTDPNYTPTSTAPTTASSTGDAGQQGQGEATQSSQGEATQSSQGEATQVSGASITIERTLFGKSRGAVVLLVTILSIL